MALNNFFTINMPYGMMENNEGDWVAFNREYQPLGGFFKDNDGGCDYPFSSVGHNNTYKEMPVHTPYIGLTDDFIRDVATWDGELHAKKTKEGKIKMFWFYGDKRLPMSSEKNMSAYLSKLKKMFALKVNIKDEFK